MTSARQAAPAPEHDGKTGGERWADSAEGEVEIRRWKSWRDIQHFNVNKYYLGTAL